MIEKIKRSISNLPKKCTQRPYYIYEDFDHLDGEKFIEELFVTFFKRLPSDEEKNYYQAQLLLVPKRQIITQIYEASPANKPPLLGFTKRKYLYKFLSILQRPFYPFLLLRSLVGNYLDMYSKLDKLQQDVLALHSEYAAIKKKFEKYKNTFKEKKPQLLPTHYQELPYYLDEAKKVSQELGFKLDESDQSFYILFENIFYNHEAVKNLQKNYLQFLPPKASILDIGCGRGEWLQIAKDAGYQVKGIDINAKNISMLKQKGFDVQEAEAIEYLQTTKESYDVITALELIEHLDFEKIRQLLSLAHKRLSPNGVLIVETVNPLANTGLGNFYMDATHQKPLPPLLIAFLLQYIGFAKTDIFFSSAVPQEYVTSFIDKNYQTYAIIARKSS